MADAIVEFPSAAESDAQDVAAAVMTANAHWQQGDFVEAIRWLRRAAETAEALGDDMRALSLARAAADLQDGVEAEKPAPGAAEATPARQPSPSSAPPPQDARSRSSRPPPTAPSVIPATRMVSISSDRMTPTVRAVPARHAMSYVPRRSEPPARRSEPPPARASDASPARASDAPPAGGSEPPPARRSDALPVRTADFARGDTHSALRVSVEPSPDDRQLLLVRILRPGEQAAIGAREALLVPLESGVDLRYL